MTLVWTPVKRVRDAQGAYCEACASLLESPYWHFTKSAGLHRRGTGHRVVYVRIAAVEA